MAKGLERRYKVERLNDPTGKHNACWFFVLDPRHDPYAREALRHYITVISAVPGYQEFAKELISKLEDAAFARATKV